jgi:hypothetical protein
VRFKSFFSACRKSAKAAAIKQTILTEKIMSIIKIEKEDLVGDTGHDLKKNWKNK